MLGVGKTEASSERTERSEKPAGRQLRRGSRVLRAPGCWALLLGRGGRGAPHPRALPEPHTHSLWSPWPHGWRGCWEVLFLCMGGAWLQRAGGGGGGCHPWESRGQSKHLSPVNPEDAVRPEGLENASIFLFLYKHTKHTTTYKLSREACSQFPNSRRRVDLAHPPVAPRPDLTRGPGVPGRAGGLL